MAISPEKMVELLRDLENATHFVIAYNVPSQKAYQTEDHQPTNDQGFETYSVQTDDMYAACGLLRMATGYVNNFISDRAEALGLGSGETNEND